MAARDRLATSLAFAGVNHYVAKMAYASNLVHGQPTAFSLGSPAAVSANNVIAAAAGNAAALTEVASTYTADSSYGRSLRFTPSGDPGATGLVVDTFGFDYLGQTMVERFTVANGSTAIVYGKKAFYKVTKSKIVTAATNAITFNVGTGFRMGLPYKCDLLWAKEAGVFVDVFKRDTYIWTHRDGALAVAGGSKYVRAPFPGFVKTLKSLADGGGGATDPVITVELGNVAITGLTVTTDTSVAGHEATDTPTTVGYNANNRFRAGDLIEIVGAAAAGAFGDSLGIELTPTQFSLPDLTDPQTNVTGDPRGTYEPIMTPNGSELVVGLVGDSSYNASGNGGLHGLRHSSS